MLKSISRTVIILLLLPGCSKSTCTVSHSTITDKNIQYRAKVSEIYYPGSGKRYVGLSQLLKGYLSLEILSNLGHPVDAAAITAEAQRIDSNTKAPEMLNKIKAVFGDNQEAYRNVFVKMTYAERVLYTEVFLKSPDVQLEQKHLAENIHRIATDTPTAMESTANKYGLKVLRLEVSNKEGIKPAGGKDTLHREPAGVEQAGVILTSLAKILPGITMPHIVEWPESFQIIKLISKRGNSAIVDSVIVPKKSYDEWFWSKAASIPVQINDQALKEELLREVSWAKNLKLE